MKNILAGIDLGGTQIKTVLLDEQQNELDRKVLKTDDSEDRPELWLEKIKTYINTLKDKYPDATINCGLAAPGLTDDRNKKIMYMPGRLDGLEGLDWEYELDVPATVINDAHAATMAEWQLGAAKGFQHVVMLTLGTGVGGAAIANGKLYKGTNSRAGHFGHITTDFRGPHTATNMTGSLEYAIGNFSVLERTLGQYADTRSLIDDYLKGNTRATYWWLESVNKLAVGICSLINAFSPEIIILGGGIAEAGESLFVPLQDFMSLYEWRPGGLVTPIKQAELGPFSGAMGAAIFSQQKQIN